MLKGHCLMSCMFNIGNYGTKTYCLTPCIHLWQKKMPVFSFCKTTEFVHISIPLNLSHEGLAQVTSDNTQGSLTQAECRGVY